MYEIIKHPNINWLGLKRPFIFVSVALLLAGLISVAIQGFNLGIDFAGGTLVTVKFKGTRPSEDKIHEALGKQGIDAGKVIIQPISDPTTGADTQVLIRLPLREPVQSQTGSSPSVGQVKAAPAQKTTQTPGATPTSPQQGGSQQAGGALTGAQTTQPAASPTTQPPPPTPAPETATAEGGQLGEEKRAILAALETFNDPADAANKADLNTVGRDRLQNRLVETDPLELVKASGQATATSEYARYADLILDYRDQSGGLINQISGLKNVPNLPPRLVEALPSHFYAGNAVMIGAEIVGPQIGEELRQRAIYVTLASFVGILLYMAFRFEWIYGVAAVVAVCHDLLVTLGIFSILQEEITLNVVAALLTLAGYSVNDTIVIFDRIRENLRFRRRDDLTALVNDSINQTLSRTILVSGLTFLAVLSLLIFGGPVLHGLALALTIGIVVGSYSTLAIASPIMVWWQQRQELRARARRRSEAGRAARDIKRKVAAS
ncbi:MAG: protein translocase subunit SecF [Acidobacteria bacterium]|nr:protein translocase subunit SecF [Acidobacteriota bacterium]